MTAYAMTPTFNDHQSYRAWMNTWKTTYGVVTTDIRTKRAALVAMQKIDPMAATTRKAQRELHHARRVANKMMTLRNEAKLRWERILKMQRDLEEQNAMFPLDLGKCSRVDFSFNKVALDFPWMPQWLLKLKGRSYYLRDVVSEVGFSTRNKAEGNTRGMLRFPNGFVSIDGDGVAYIRA